MADEAGARLPEEVLKLRFEFFKHMTTVSTAATAAVVAVYGLSKKPLRGAAENLSWPDWVVLSIPMVAIAGFFISLILSLWGLYLAADAGHSDDNAGILSWMLKLCAVTFIVGVGLSVVAAAVVVAGPVTFIFLAIFASTIMVLALRFFLIAS